MSYNLDDAYLGWLYGKVASTLNRNPAHSRWEFVKQLYSKEFIWFVANDDNRIADAMELRRSFISEMELTQVDAAWMDLGCSMMELFVVLSEIGQFETDESPVVWFWRLVDHAGLKANIDEVYSNETRRINDEILDRIIYRTYSINGHGGLFPLKKARNDQRKTELWYQMSAWILENYSIE